MGQSIEPFRFSSDTHRIFFVGLGSGDVFLKKVIPSIC